MDKDTEALENEIRAATDIMDYFEGNEMELDEIRLTDYLLKLLEEKQLSRAEVIRSSGLEHSYANHIFSGQKVPGRDKLLRLALAMHCTEKESQRLLYAAGHEKLYARSYRDSILLFAIKQGMDVMDTNELLYALSEIPLAS